MDNVNDDRVVQILSLLIDESKEIKSPQTVRLRAFWLVMLHQKNEKMLNVFVS